MQSASLPRSPSRTRRWLAIFQGTYYLATGVWPLVSIDTFQRITGRKRDRWLVKTVGVLVTVVGAALLRSAFRPGISAEAPVLAVGSAVGLGAIDVIYVARRTLSPVYLLDAALEAVLAAAWLATQMPQREAQGHEAAAAGTPLA